MKVRQGSQNDFVFGTAIQLKQWCLTIYDLFRIECGKVSSDHGCTASNRLVRSPPNIFGLKLLQMVEFSLKNPIW